MKLPKAEDLEGENKLTVAAAFVASNLYFSLPSLAVKRLKYQG